MDDMPPAGLPPIKDIIRKESCVLYPSPPSEF